MSYLGLVVDGEHHLRATRDLQGLQGEWAGSAGQRETATRGSCGATPLEYASNVVQSMTYVFSSMKACAVNAGQVAAATPAHLNLVDDHGLVSELHQGLRAAQRQRTKAGAITADENEGTHVCRERTIDAILRAAAAGFFRAFSIECKSTQN